MIWALAQAGNDSMASFTSGLPTRKFKKFPPSRGRPSGSRWSWQCGGRLCVAGALFPRSFFPLKVFLHTFAPAVGIHPAFSPAPGVRGSLQGSTNRRYWGGGANTARFPAEPALRDLAHPSHEMRVFAARRGGSTKEFAQVLNHRVMVLGRGRKSQRGLPIPPRAGRGNFGKTIPGLFWKYPAGMQCPTPEASMVVWQWGATAKRD